MPTFFEVLAAIRPFAPYLFGLICLGLIVHVVLCARAFNLEMADREFGDWPPADTPLHRSSGRKPVGSADRPRTSSRAAGRTILGLGAFLLGVEALFFFLPPDVLAMLPGGLS